MSKTALILAVLCFGLVGCKQRQHISKANIAVVQRALAAANDADVHFVRLKLPVGGRVRDPAAPTPSRLAAPRPGGPDLVVTAKEVESVLGPPHEVYPSETALRDVEVFRYYYYQDADRYEFNFHDGRLIEINLMPPGRSAKKS